MKKLNAMKSLILTVGFIFCCGAIFVSCTEEEITPGFERTQLIEDVVDVDVVDGNGNDGNSNADGPRGKDHDVIDIDIL
jgi:hypothetical protein